MTKVRRKNIKKIFTVDLIGSVECVCVFELANCSVQLLCTRRFNVPTETDAEESKGGFHKWGCGGCSTAR